MKRKILILFFLICLLMPYYHSLAASTGKLSIIMDGSEMVFETEPFIENGVTMVPLRAIFEKFNMNVEWNETNQTVVATKKDIKIKMQIGSKTAYLNNSTVELLQNPELINGHTFIPLRFISESIGGKVVWDGNINTVFIISNELINESSNGLNHMPTINTISKENLNPGNKYWRINKAAHGEIQGYSSATSVNRGDNISFYISTQEDKTNYAIDIYRLGWYQGSGARLYKSVKNLQGRAQGWWSEKKGGYNLPSVDEKTKLLDLKWSSSYELNIPLKWVSGYYIAKLTDMNGFQSYIPFIVRDDFTQHDLLAQASVTTWQAYNSWGGWSLYGHYDNENRKFMWTPENDDDEKAYQDKSASMVSYNRPYAIESGAGGMLLEYSTVYWLESQGYDVSYVTSIDTHLNRTKWKPKGFLSIAHDEYYSREMKTNVTSMRDTGIHLAFLGANDIYWQIRFQPGSLGENGDPRIQVCYKHNWDPIEEPKLKTVKWRSLGEPENEILGQMYETTIQKGADWMVTNTNHWLYEGTQAKEGDIIPGLVGWEYDRIYDNGHTPANLEVISTSTFTKDKYKLKANTTIYKSKAGSYVFDAGTIYWGYGLSNPLNLKTPPVDSRIQGITKNLVDKFLQ